MFADILKSDVLKIFTKSVRIIWLIVKQSQIIAPFWQNKQAMTFLLPHIVEITLPNKSVS